MKEIDYSKSKLLDHYDDYKFKNGTKQDKYNDLLTFIHNYKIFLQTNGIKVKKINRYFTYSTKHIFYNPHLQRLEWNSFFQKKYIFIYRIKNIHKSQNNDKLVHIYYTQNNIQKCATFLFQNTMDRMFFFDAIYGLLSIL